MGWMSKPRYRWWGYVKAMLRAYPEDVTAEERGAIESAIEETKQMVDGNDRLKVIDLVFFSGTHKLAGAAMQVPCSIDTAQKYHADFIRKVGNKFRCNGLK